MKNLFTSALFACLFLAFIPAKAQQPTSKSDSVYIKVEEMPEFPGGEQEMMKFLAKNVRYPITALKEGIEGLVVAQFIVNTEGQIYDTKIIKHLGGGTDEETMRVIASMPDWKPGKQNGKAINVRYTMPIRFTIGSKKKKKKKEKQDQQKG